MSSILLAQLITITQNLVRESWTLNKHQTYSNLLCYGYEKHSVSTFISVHRKSLAKMKNRTCGNLLFVVPHSLLFLGSWLELLKYQFTW